MRFDGYDIAVTEKKVCRRLILHARDGVLSLSVPVGTTEEQIRSFLTQNRAWIAKHSVRPAAGQAPAAPRTQLSDGMPMGRVGAQLMRLDDYEILVTPRRNCQRITLRARQGEGTLNLSVPMSATVEEVRGFLERNRAWISAHGRRAQEWTPVYAAGEVHPLLGDRVVLGANGMPSGRAFVQWRADRLTAVVRELVPLWARRMGVQPGGVRFREMKSRWGSCQLRTHEITLNTNLGKMPPACIEYVVVHELCHLLVPDHSPAFHAQMTRFLPDWQARKQALNRFDTTPQPHA